MLQALMQFARPLALTLAMCLLAVSAPAQQMESAKLNASLPTPTVAGDVTPSDKVSSVPAGEPLLRAATPQKVEEHKFFDKQQMVALYVHGGVRTADTIVTCHNIANGATEMWIPTQSCAGITAWQAGSVGLALGIGWIFHKTGHHKLERITPWVGTGASAAGLTKSAFNIH